MHLELTQQPNAAGQYRIKKYRSLPLPKSVKIWLLRRGLLERFCTYTSPFIKNTISAADTHGFNIIARRLAGDTAYDIIITQAKIGTGTTAPTSSDTDLETPTLSGITLANQSYSGAQATLQFFITDAELSNGTYTEFGIFAEDQLFARSLISPSHLKSSNEDTSIDYQVNFANA